MQHRPTAVVPLLLLAWGGHAAFAPVPRPRIGRPRCAAVSAHAPAPRATTLPAGDPDMSYLRREVVRPISVHARMYWKGLRRHMRGRAQLTRSSFDGEAAAVTWAGAAVNLLLTGLKLVAGIVGHSSAMLADAGHSLSDLLTDAVTLVTLRLVRQVARASATSLALANAPQLGSRSLASPHATAARAAPHAATNPRPPLPRARPCSRVGRPCPPTRTTTHTNPLTPCPSGLTPCPSPLTPCPSPLTFCPSHSPSVPPHSPPVPPTHPLSLPPFPVRAPPRRGPPVRPRSL
jgi:hypothetical protein